MAQETLTQTWRAHFFRNLEHSKAGKFLKAAAVEGKLGDWTSALTSAVVETCTAMGWRSAAKGFPGSVLPHRQSEYLAIDVFAFDESTARWPFPVAVFELENTISDDRVGYSLWKVLCVRAQGRFVFAYHRDASQGTALVDRLTDSFIGSLSIADRLAIRGETTLIIGNRGGSETFPYGYFKAWTLNTNTGQFDRV